MNTYQQGIQRIEVIVRKEGGSATTGANETSSDNVSATSGTDNRGAVARSNARQKRIILTNTTHLLALARQEANLWTNYAISGMGMKYGDQALQDNIQRQVEQMKDATGLASAVGMGMLFGAWGGPVGIAVGGIIGAVGTGGSLLAKYMGREREFNYKRFKEDNAIEYRRARASINMTTGRLR